MQTYGTKELQRLLGVSAGTVRSAVRAGYVAPRRDRRGALRFSFHDLIVVRTASTLSAAKVSPKRVAQSMRALRRQLPKQAPLSGLAIVAVGDRIAVREGAQRWDTSSGQYLLALDVQVEEGELRIMEAHLQKQAAQAMEAAEAHQAGQCEARFEAALELEGQDLEQALDAYRECLAAGTGHLGAYINSGRLLHELGRYAEAEKTYRRALHDYEDATLCFNLAVLLEDQGRDEDAIAAYEQALRLDPSLADAHFNLGRLHEAAGNERECLRHLSAYRRQQS